MANIFTVNGKQYIAKPFNFRMLRELGKMGVKIDEIEDDPLPMIEAYFTICSELDSETAIDEITNMDDVTAIMNALTAEMGDADFFRSREKGTKKTTQQSKQKAVKE